MNLAELILHSNLPLQRLTDEQSKRLKATLVGMYQDIAAVCEKHQFPVMLSGGSCLGAVRHQGFIPWDDDMDLIMFRKDYERLPQLMSETYGDKYHCVGANINADGRTPFMKIERADSVIQTIYDLPDEEHGIGIDIFPIDNVPDRTLPRLWHGFWLNLLQYIALCIDLYDGRRCYATQLLKSSKEGKRKIGLRLSVGRLFGKVVSCAGLYAITDRLAAKYNADKTRAVTIASGRAHYFGELQDRSVFLPMQEAVFETQKVYIPHDAKAYLTALYGDSYMQLPPLDKREQHFIAKLRFPEN